MRIVSPVVASACSADVVCRAFSLAPRRILLRQQKHQRQRQQNRNRQHAERRIAGDRRGSRHQERAKHGSRLG